MFLARDASRPARWHGEPDEHRVGVLFFLDHDAFKVDRPNELANCKQEADNIVDSKSRRVDDHTSPPDEHASQRECECGLGILPQKLGGREFVGATNARGTSFDNISKVGRWVSITIGNSE